MKPAPPVTRTLLIDFIHILEVSKLKLFSNHAPKRYLPPIHIKWAFRQMTLKRRCPDTAELEKLVVETERVL
jgi:hypothetical protein